MSIIAIHGLPIKFSLADVVKALARAINGHFEALNFKTPKWGKGGGRPKQKTCYIRLSEKLDPVRIVEKINDFAKKFNKKFIAAIPDKVPDIPLGAKPKGLPLKLRMALRIPDEDPYHQVLKLASDEILTELQAKYPGLQSLCKSTDFRLTDELRQKIFTRVEALAQKTKSQEPVDNCFKMTKDYRRAHPHFGDFQFVLSTLHAIQDSTGVPRSQLQESDLSAAAAVPHELDLPRKKITQLCNQYSEKIVKRMTEHIMGLQSDISPTDTEDEIARKQVREELKKLNPFLPEVINLVVHKHFLQKDGPYYRVRIYGEPFLPNKETMRPFLSRYKPTQVLRSTRMYNMIKFNVPPAFFHSLMAMNGTVLNGAKLMICSSDVAKYNRRHAPLGGEDDEGDGGDDDDDNDDDDEEMEEEQKEDWTELPADMF